MCQQDNGNGIRGSEGASGFPTGLSVGAAWNKSSALLGGHYIGAEFKRKGANVALGPVVGPVG